MWEHTLIESNGFGRSKNRWWTIPAAAGLHLAFILTGIFLSYWHLEAVEAPADRLTYIHVVPVAIAPPPQLGGGGSKPKDVVVKKAPAPMIQPQEVPELTASSSLPVEEFRPENLAGSADALPGEGDPNGVEGGMGSDPSGSQFLGSAEEPPRVIVSGMLPPILLKRVEPEYPRTAMAARLQGIVVLEAVISKRGDVEQIKTLRSDNQILEKAALDAVVKWKYKPATIQGRPVRVYFTVTVRFHMR